jgi:hypothetical protein
MSVYDLHFNKDDVTIRNIIIGLLATLYDNIGWYNQIGTSVEQKQQIKVPFYFSTTGTERYLQDNFLNNVDFDPEMLQAETFYNKIPRGVIDMTGISVETAAIVNKYVRMQHQVQENDGTLNTYNTEAFMVPIIINVDAVVYVDSILDQMKCTESIIRTFFKNKTYQIDTAYTRIPCLITFPDDYNMERSIEFSFSDKKEFKVSFALQIKAHLPVFKPETTYFAGNTMEGFQANTYLPPLAFGPSGGGNSALFGNQGNGPVGSTQNGTNGNSFGSTESIAPTGPTPSGIGGNTLGPTAVLTPPGATTYIENTIPLTDGPWPVNPGGEIPPLGGTGY